MTDFTPSSQLFSEAAVLLMVGMAFVFAFLSLLIIVIKLFIAPLGVRFPDVATKKPEKSPDSNQPTAVVAAISVAIKQYREKHK